MKGMKELLSTERKLRDNLNVIKEEIQKRKTEKILPALKKKYEGKCFKTSNSYGSGDEWLVFTIIREVREVVDGIYCLVFTFQKTTHNEFWVDSRDEGYSTYIEHIIHGKSISRAEFEMEWRAFQGDMLDCYKKAIKVEG